MRKSQQIKDIEARFGVPLADVVVDVFNRHGNVAAAAHHLGVKESTFSFWKNRLGLQFQRTLVAPRERG